MADVPPSDAADLLLSLNTQSSAPFVAAELAPLSDHPYPSQSPPALPSSTPSKRIILNIRRQPKLPTPPVSHTLTPGELSPDDPPFSIQPAPHAFATSKMTRSNTRQAARRDNYESESEFEAEATSQSDDEPSDASSHDVKPTRGGSRNKRFIADNDSEDEYEEQERKREDRRNLRAFVDEDDEDEEDEDGRPIRKRQRVRAFPARAARQTSTALDRSDSSAKDQVIRRSSRPRGEPTEEDNTPDPEGQAAPDEVGANGDGGDLAVEQPAPSEDDVMPAPRVIIEVDGLVRPNYAEDSDDEGENELNPQADDDDEHPIRQSGRRLTRASTASVTATASPPKGRQTRNSRRIQFDDAYEEEESEGPTTRNLRTRTSRPNYALIPSSDVVANNSRGERDSHGRKSGGKSGSGGSKRSGGGYNRIPWNSTGRELSRHLGLSAPGEDSDDDLNANAPKKTPGSNLFPTLGGAGGNLFGAGGAPLPLDSGPSNLGKVGDAALSDADPLGVNTKVSFDSVGGLDGHIQQLKEMVSLPLMYPELFQRFNVTPPRGVLFHGPPGTGKTLVARALAASCSTGGTKISFFMRKGADCLSKWVGEAERQLRLLFEEARACQPSIIFFDEIDGLAPVRSSKQDQIHASIVSTLLALMDGMDGRGQVIIIGATNRPDAVDPALRRPGRFDREFYFPLPNKTARRTILDIHTTGWEPALGDAFLDNLAGITKGYGGADLRALCTEASLNAIQRRYPQIYKTNDRLLLEPETITVQARDFMASVKKLIPSSARATASAAASLPAQLAPLLAPSLESILSVIDKVLPPAKKQSVLEEAEWESDDPQDGSFEKELLLQSLDTLRVYRPRVLVHGEPGMGQGYLGSAALHHLEGFHVQSLDLGTLMSDSTRSIEAAIVQLFVEAKRHKPSVLYIPALTQWAAAVPEMARSIVKALLDSLSPSDSVMLLAMADGDLKALPRDVKSWFGHLKDNRVLIRKPSQGERAAFFAGLIDHAIKPPNEFPDGVPKKKRVLEILPIAPPLPPREPSAVELAAQAENDARLREHVKWRLGPVLTELKRKYKRFMRPVQEDLDVYDQTVGQIQQADLADAEAAAAASMIIDENGAGPSGHAHAGNGDGDPMSGDPAPPILATRELPRKPHDIDLEKMHSKLYYDRYLTPEQFLEDLIKIVENAELDLYDSERLWKAKQMLNQASLLVDGCCDAGFRLECRRMAQREADRETKRAAEKAKEKGQSGPVDAGTDSPRAARASTRGTATTLEFTLSDPVAIERKAKRARAESAGASTTPGSIDGEIEEPPLQKRTKTDVAESEDVQMAEVSSPLQRPHGKEFSTSNGPVTISATTVTNSVVLEGALPPAPTSSFVPSSSLAAEDVSIAKGAIAEAATLNEAAAGPPSESSPSADAPTAASSGGHPEYAPAVELAPSPPLPPPPFVLPPAALAELSNLLTMRTARLNIEQLEQLRASLLSCVWHRRAEWDRTALLGEMKASLETFVAEVEEELDDEWA